MNRPTKKQLRAKRKKSSNRIKRNASGMSVKKEIKPAEYIAPKTWSEGAQQPSIPNDPMYRTLFFCNINVLCEHALGMKMSVPLEDASCVWHRIEQFRLDNREKILKNESETRANSMGKTALSRQSIWQIYMVLCRTKFVTHGAEWVNSTISGSDFAELCEKRIVVDLDLPIAKYDLGTLRLAIFRLQREWDKINYSDQLVSYIDHLERRVCTFLSGTFPDNVLNYDDWCVRAPLPLVGVKKISSSKRRQPKHQMMMMMQTNTNFLTMVEILFYEMRSELYDFNRMRKQVKIMQQYEIEDIKILERFYSWINRIVKDVYEEIVKEKFRNEFVESCILIGERELYTYKNDDKEGMLHSAQAVISCFRPDKLEKLEEICDMMIVDVLTKLEDVNARDLMIMEILEFYYAGLHSGEKQENRSFRTQYTLLDYENAVPDDVPASSYSFPIIIRAFHCYCVLLADRKQLVFCDDFSHAFCYWLECGKNNETFLKRDPEIQKVYEYIFNSVDYQELRRNKSNKVYEKRKYIAEISEWKIDDDDDDNNNCEDKL